MSAGRDGRRAHGSRRLHRLRSACARAPACKTTHSPPCGLLERERRREPFFHHAASTAHHCTQQRRRAAPLLQRRTTHPHSINRHPPCRKARAHCLSCSLPPLFCSPPSFLCALHPPSPPTPEGTTTSPPSLSPLFPYTIIWSNTARPSFCLRSSGQRAARGERVSMRPNPLCLPLSPTASSRPDSKYHTLCFASSPPPFLLERALALQPPSNSNYYGQSTRTLLIISPFEPGARARPRRRRLSADNRRDRRPRRRPPARPFTLCYALLDLLLY